MDLGSIEIVLFPIVMAIIGGLFGIVFVADFWRPVKEKSKFKLFSSKLSGIIYIVIGFLPQFYEKLQIDVSIFGTTCYLAGFGISAMATVLYGALIASKPLVAKCKEINKTFSRFELVISGYTACKKEIENSELLFHREQKKLIYSNDNMDSFSSKFLEYIKEIWAISFLEPYSKYKYKDRSMFAIGEYFLTCATLMITLCHQEFFPKAQTCFIIRVYDKKMDAMVAVAWPGKRHEVPPDIPMSNGNNMIKRSIELNNTAIFSENDEYHSILEKNPFEPYNGIKGYKDYAVQYIGTHNVNNDEIRPYSSIGIYVKEDSIKHLKLAAHFGILKFIGQALKDVVKKNKLDPDEVIDSLLNKRQETLESIKDITERGL